jgi:uncharacterized protein (UPF0332 family)
LGVGVNERDFLTLATVLAGGATEASWRTAVGRAYYAAFHVARRLLEDVGFAVPRADRAHTYLSFRLQNCGDAPVETAGAKLQVLRTNRNLVDYDLRRSIGQPAARLLVAEADKIIRALDVARSQPTRSQIAAAMRVYERDVLRDVTWQGP